MRIVCVVVLLVAKVGLCSALLTDLLMKDCYMCAPFDNQCLQDFCPFAIVLKRQLGFDCLANCGTSVMCRNLCAIYSRKRELECYMCGTNLNCLVSCGFVGVGK
ncbi:hypothetical protein Btru_000404 [Bulinus truncatus]|nr:hypothetical protein Btru_000404 [Bulinus truncatus]